MNIVAIIQARMTSSRLPGKVMMSIGGKPIIQMLIERVKRSRHISKIVVAVPMDDKCDSLLALCKSIGVETFRGSETDVLSRFTDTARFFKADIVVRLCSDCPFNDPEILDRTIELYLNGSFDYVNNVGKRSFPDGLDVEVFSADSLYRANREAKHPLHREHVTTYMDGRIPGLEHGNFKCMSMDIEPSYGHLMWSVNTTEHLEHLRKIYDSLPDKNNFGWRDILAVEEKTNV